MRLAKTQALTKIQFSYKDVFGLWQGFKEIFKGELRLNSLMFGKFWNQDEKHTLANLQLKSFVNA